MFRNALWALRQPRYATLAALMVVVALGCVAAGTWQISRYQQTVRENDVLRGNASRAAVPLTTSLVPLVGDGPAPGRDAVRYRQVVAVGRYEAPTQFVLYSDDNLGDGFAVLDRFRTKDGVLLVLRGFVPQTAASLPPKDVPAPPTGEQRIVGRLQTPDTADDGAGRKPDGQLATVNPREQAARLDAPVYNAYLNLNTRQPGTHGLQSLPGPDLSNPAGGAAEWQHMAYIVQWYIFALLALAAPFVIARHEVREARKEYLGYDEDAVEIDAEPAADRLQLTAGESGSLVRRRSGDLARPGGPTPEQWERAARLADRYGRSLGRAHEPTGAPLPRRRTRPVGGVPRRTFRPATSSTSPARSPDSYHAEYNDYLWRLAMADGNIPQVEVQSGKAQPTTENAAEPVVIDVPADPET